MRCSPVLVLWWQSTHPARRVAGSRRHRTFPLSNNVQITPTDTKLLILGVLSFLFYPFTAVPGIVIGGRQPSLSSRGKLGYSLCWICLILFCIHLVLVTIMILAGMSRH